MEPWQIDAVKTLLETETKEVEAGERVYIASSTYGKSLYHLFDKKREGGVQVEQVDVDEKWNKRVNFYGDEMPAILKTLLDWYLKDVHERELRRQQVDLVDEELGDLDDHPF